MHIVQLEVAKIAGGFGLGSDLHWCSFESFKRDSTQCTWITWSTIFGPMGPLIRFFSVWVFFNARSSGHCQCVQRLPFEKRWNQDTLPARLGWMTLFNCPWRFFQCVHRVIMGNHDVIMIWHITRTKPVLMPENGASLVFTRLSRWEITTDSGAGGISKSDFH